MIVLLVKDKQMKKILLTLTLLVSTTTFAQHGYWRHDGRGGWNWMAPVVVGGVIGYELARPPVVVQQPPVVVQQPPVVVQPSVQAQNCTPWTETQNPNGTITRTRTCNQ